MFGSSRKRPSESERVTEAKRKRAANAGYGPDSELCNAILEVQGHQLHVNKEVLMLSSPVFRQLFNSSFKETQTDPPIVNLTGKCVESVLWLLDYIYPGKDLDINDGMAATLVPIAHEYQIKPLLKRCEIVLREQQNPRLDIVVLAEKYNLPTLLEETITACAKLLTPHDLSSQTSVWARRDRPTAIPTDSSMLKIYKLKTENLTALCADVHRDIRNLRSSKYCGTCKEDLAKTIEKIDNNPFYKS